MSLGAATAEDVAFVRKQLGTTEQNIQQAVSSLRNWLNLQPHLPKNIDDRRLERLFINCKCSMERVKTSLDAYFSLKKKFPELLMNRDPEDADIKKAKDFIKTFSTSPLTAEGLRVTCTLDVAADPQCYDPLLCYKLILMWTEVLLAEDYSLGDIIIVDLKDFTASHVLKTSVSLVRSVEIIFKEAYCRRIKAVHLVNSPKVLDAILNIAKAALSDKLKQRVVTHLPGTETLFDYVPRELVPDELGGSAGPAEKLYDAAWKKVSSYRAFFLEQDNYVTDESRRPPGSRNVSDLYGVEGSFRKLAID
ncbi:alpha-tocopherol transfer protein-like [Schistocerca gregaria]|uniref:alpha-tocopherol transfer protein-like n=1 Tax=Schistocerca gregaria TaxID=7010 RepID=UPI00211F1C53|nr:alpha-tocopherol transfer protein-like [Schistocerca gregaria]XP_049864358.1 alpha-tocopherol transfer protein-like [Schistocerca gregaria]